MPQLSIRLPNKMYQKIKKEAVNERRSLNAQILKLLEDTSSAIIQEKKENYESG